MDLTTLRKHPSFWIAAILLLFMGLALVLRMIPVLFIKDPGFLYIYDTDSWYTLRQVEVMVRDFPLYNWFDPMTAFPDGKTIDWGPLYPFIAATLCLITGATTRSGIIFSSGWVAPLMAVAMVPVMYQLGKTVWDGKTGIIAAGLVSVVSLHYFSISSYGWVDHHSAEVLFSTLFFLSYISTLSYVKSHPVYWNYPKTLIFPVFLSVLTGLIYFLGLLSSTTVLLVLVVIAIYTFVQTILDYFSGQPSEYLLILNIGLLGISTIFLFLFGIKQPGVSLIQYTIGLVYVNLALIGETVLLYTVSRIFHGKKWLFLGSFAVLAIIGIFFIQSVPVLQSFISQAEGLLSGSSAYSVGVVETLPWTLSAAWENFTIALILMAGGLLVLLYSGIKKRNNQSVFLVVWSVVMILLTIRFQRFAYFFTVNVVLLAAICIAEPIGWRENKIVYYLTTVFSRFFKGTVSPGDADRNPSKKPATKKEKKNTPKRSARNPVNYPDTLKDLAVISIIILTIGLFAISLYDDIQYGVSTPHREISPDWVESLEWLQENTPQTGIDYFRQYDVQGFSYPPESYGVMAVWDAGHWITFIAHRIPITNPFQNNLDGPGGAAAFFLSRNESKADAILQNFRGKYVITDSNMAVDSFTNLVPWQSASVDISPYIKWFLIPDTKDSSRLLKVHRFDDDYFQTMVVRLHSFDGSMTLQKSVDYIQYEIRQVPAPGETAGDVNGYARVIADESPLDVSGGLTGHRIIKESTELVPTHYANVFSAMPDRPVQKVPALRHYRLIHESPDNASVTMFPESTPVTLPGIKGVKIFEFVRGAQIPGEGIIELTVVTNTGRVFVYRQESDEGMFIVPYSTQGNPYEVRATGQYHIVGTSQYINVTESDVIQGNRVAG
jgi:dolichyl-diphosphooligosaccharide--protein glycosyltransferase